MKTGRLSAALAEPGVAGLHALGSSSMAAVVMAATALLDAVAWGEPPGPSDWEALSVEGLCLVRRGGAMVSLQRDATGRPLSFALTDPAGEALVCTWAPDGSYVAEHPGGEAWAVSAAGEVRSADEILARVEEGVDRLDERFSEATERDLGNSVPTDPAAGPGRLWGDTDEEEAQWSGDMLLPGLSLSALGGLAAAWRVVGKAQKDAAAPVAPVVPAAKVAEVAPAAPVAPASRACGGCGRSLAADARFCSGCGKPVAPRCPACGLEALPGARFCRGCGGKIG